MPIYEYQALNLGNGCVNCADPFEVIQRASDKPLTHCPSCGERVTKLISWCRAAVVQYSDIYRCIEKQIETYEKAGRWSHAAELADKQSEKIKKTGMKLRAFDNYAKAGYDVKTLEKHEKNNFSDND